MATPETGSTACLVCSGTTSAIYQLPAERIRRDLGQLFQDSTAEQLRLGSYEIRRCAACDLEFANPATPGDHAFYTWLAGHQNYYPAERWEWAWVRERLRQIAQVSGKQGILLLDVGCGSGDFLATIRELPGIRAIGLDPTESSVERCRQRGLDVYRGDLDALPPGLPARFDVVVSFHCLEHVPSPNGFLGAICELLADPGQILLSVPYSPTALEARWHDPLNHPPHHMTRWSRTSMRALAQRHGLVPTFFPGLSYSLVQRVILVTKLHAYPPFAVSTRAQRVARFVRQCLLHPIELCRDLAAQLGRARIDGKPAPEILLVEMQRQ